MTRQAQPSTRGPIVVGYDGTEASERALDHGLRQALLNEVDVVVIVVGPSAVEIDPYDLGGIGTAYVVPIPPEGPVEIQPLLTRAHRRLDASGVQGTVEWSVGDPAQEIVRLAEERRASSIVVGSDHHSALGRFFGTDTAANITRAAPCDVVVAP